MALAVPPTLLNDRKRRAATPPLSDTPHRTETSKCQILDRLNDEVLLAIAKLSGSCPYIAAGLPRSDLLWHVKCILEEGSATSNRGVWAEIIDVFLPNICADGWWGGREPTGTNCDCFMKALGNERHWSCCCRNKRARTDGSDTPNFTQKADTAGPVLVSSSKGPTAIVSPSNRNAGPAQEAHPIPHLACSANHESSEGFKYHLLVQSLSAELALLPVEAPCIVGVAGSESASFANVPRAAPWHVLHVHYYRKKSDKVLRLEDMLLTSRDDGNKIREPSSDSACRHSHVVGSKILDLVEGGMRPARAFAAISADAGGGIARDRLIPAFPGQLRVSGDAPGNYLDDHNTKGDSDHILGDDNSRFRYHEEGLPLYIWDFLRTQGIRTPSDLIDASTSLKESIVSALMKKIGRDARSRGSTSAAACLVLLKKWQRDVANEARCKSREGIRPSHHDEAGGMSDKNMQRLKGTRLLRSALRWDACEFLLSQGISTPDGFLSENLFTHSPLTRSLRKHRKSMLEQEATMNDCIKLFHSWTSKACRKWEMEMKLDDRILSRAAVTRKACDVLLNSGAKWVFG